MLYRLEDKQVIKEPNALVWSRWFETANRVVKKTQVAPEVEVSTVFLGVDHSFGGEVPMLFETMIFGGSRDGEQWRYSTYAEAEEGHQAVVDQFNQTSP